MKLADVVQAQRADVPLRLTLSIPAETGAVRGALAQIRAWLAQAGVPDDVLGRVELVLAEVLNNIVEHAYAEAGGTISLQLGHYAQALSCRVADTGHPMPGGQLPAGALQPHDLTDLPEGGFGWHLIRTLSHDLAYARVAGQNLLTFQIPLLANGE